jgi:hypothetical protein
MLRPGSIGRASPRDVVDLEKRRGGNGRWRQPGKGHDISVKVGLIGVTALVRLRRACDRVGTQGTRPDTIIPGN